MDTQEIVEGLVTEIIFSNEENGYTVCETETEDGDIVLVGVLPGLHPGENIKAAGQWKVHPTYGEQFQVESFEKTIPQTVQAIEKYLASGVIKGIGPALAKRIVKHFKEKTLEIIEEESERLEEIKGISLEKAQSIGAIFHNQRELRRAVLFLQDYGITPAYALRIYKKYRENTVEIIQINPYRLAEDIIGIGFKKADQIAETVGIDRESPHRVMSGIQYILNQSAGNGHAYLPKEKLLEETVKLLNIPEEIMENALLELQMNKQIFQERKDEEIRVYGAPFYYGEINVAKQILELAGTKETQEEAALEKIIESVQKEIKIELAQCQREAVKEAFSEGVLIITGGPGTGKTTTINTIITLLEQQELSVLLAAPTGRAAKRMTEATGREALTIHRLLEVNYLKEDGSNQMFGRNEENPLETDVLIIDEMSMVDILLMNSLLKAVVPGTRLILVGDVDQLPSVGPGNVLRDLINSGVLKVVRLTEIFRQAQQSAIVMNAHEINKGRYPVLNDKKKDFFFIKRALQKDVLDTLVELIKFRLPKFAKCSAVESIQVLSPMRKGPLGVYHINERLQEELNPKRKDKKERVFPNGLFRVGDKVMQIKNNYNIVWKVYNQYQYPLDEGVGIFNGDFGVIQDIDERLEKVVVKFDDCKVVEYDYSMVEELELAYAVTIHKSQGSEFPIVILPIHSGPPMLMNRNLLYTAVTRAKQYVVMVGLESMVRKMVDNKREVNRYSSLEDRLKQYQNLFTI